MGNEDNRGERENKKNIGFPDSETDLPGKRNGGSNQSLPSDGPVSKSEGSNSGDLNENVEKDDRKDVGT